MSKEKKMAKIFLSMQKLYKIILSFLTLKAPIMTAADDIHKYLLIVFQRQ